MNIVCDGDYPFDCDRVISNARFDYRPKCIYYCERVADVKRVVDEARNNGWHGRVRIRSGGHQHEGMCSGNGVHMIDVSRLDAIEYRKDEELVTIGAGAALKDIYYDLWWNGYMFPGGGCGDVHVGGLAQGGGWGPAARKYGLTCDSLVAVDIVTAAGEILEIPRPNRKEDLDLIWALRGGGGGNFGVVTRYHFRLHPWSHGYTDLTYTWTDKELPGDRLDAFIFHWTQSFPRDLDLDLTTFLRVSAVDKDTDTRVVLGGRFLGDIDGAKKTLDRLLKDQPKPATTAFTPTPLQRPPGSRPGLHEEKSLRRQLGTLQDYQPGPPLKTTGGPTSQEANLGDTCIGVPLRHKVSSGFAKPGFSGKAVKELTTVIRAHGPWPESRLYVSFHCLGGAIDRPGHDSSYAFRGRDFLLQYQAWWQPDAFPIDGHCLGWISHFQRVMSPHTNGAFINFADKNIPLTDYYGGSMTRLEKVKKYWDEGNLFKFDMGILP